MNFKKEIQDNVNKIYYNEKRINQVILDLQRSNLNLIKNQKEAAKIVISIDKQQQRIITQMNFIAKSLDKLNKDTEAIKNEQNKMHDNLLLCLSAETKSSEILKTIKIEILDGNKENLDKMGKIHETICTIDDYFHRFESSMKSVNNLVVDYLNDIRKNLNMVTKQDLDLVKKVISSTDLDSETKENTNDLNDNQTKTGHKTSKELVKLGDRDDRMNDQVKGLVKIEKPKAKRIKKTKIGSRYKIVKTPPVRKAVLIRSENAKDEILNKNDPIQISKFGMAIKLDRNEMKDAKELLKDIQINEEVAIKENELKNLKTTDSSEQVKTEIKDKSIEIELNEENGLKINKLKSSYDKANYEATETFKDDKEKIIRSNEKREQTLIEEVKLEKINAKEADNSSDNLTANLKDDKKNKSLTESQDLPETMPYLKKDPVVSLNSPKLDSSSVEHYLTLLSSSESSSSDEESKNNQTVYKTSKKSNETNDQINHQIKKSNEMQTKENKGTDEDKTK